MSNTMIQDSEYIDWEAFLAQGFFIQKPDSNIIWGGYGQSDSGDLSFFHTKFFDSKPLKYLPEHTFQIKIEEFCEAIERRLLDKCFLRPHENRDHDFRHDLETCLEWIRLDPKILKLVPTSVSTYSRNEVHPISNISKLGNVGGYLYGFWDTQGGILGATPEYLFLREKEFYRFHALAGTLPKEQKEDLIKSAKDLKEHEFVVEDIQSKLAQLNFEKIKREPTGIKSFGNLVHLETKLESHQNQSVQTSKLIDGLHPTAALGGFPGKGSLSYLKQLEIYKLEKNERIFGGVIGFETKDFAMGLVMIRNLQWNQQEAYIYSGCGVVAESSIENEMDEVKNKRMSIESLYG